MAYSRDDGRKPEGMRGAVETKGEKPVKGLLVSRLISWGPLGSWVALILESSHHGLGKLGHLSADSCPALVSVLRELPCASQWCRAEMTLWPRSRITDLEEGSCHLVGNHLPCCRVGMAPTSSPTRVRVHIHTHSHSDIHTY